MHIAFNTYSPFTGGVRSYIVKLATELPTLYPETRFTVFISPQVADVCNIGLPNVELVVFDSERRSFLNQLYWEQVQLPRQLKRRQVDLLYTFFATDVFLAPCPTIIRIGNMAPYDRLAVKVEKPFRSRFRLTYLRWVSRLSAVTADGVLVQSQFAANELINKHSFPKRKTHGINRGFDIQGIDGNSNFQHDLPNEYILCVSHILRYKMLIEVVDAYKSASQRVDSLPPLIIAGAEKDRLYAKELQQQIADHNLQEKVLFVGYIPRDALKGVIEGSTISIFSSLVETFPTTLIEQLSVGAAMIVSNRGRYASIL